ncbi:ATP-binding protein [Streptomyces sulphureus]|uniref:ATP-binding protein n=1 Tax=Streptomyces sulphureus TaxID=47758 RepID=UPI00035FE3E8|nr:ATP-binding protein [Streptomyces sulphureus]
MATVELRFSPLPEHVRTARLVAAAVARRAGVDEAVLDEVRLAVGEACTRAVALHSAQNLSSPVRVALVEDEKKFSIEVGDSGPPPQPAESLPAEQPASAPEEEGEGEMGLAVISGLVDDLEVGADDEGGLIRMSWPVIPDEEPV